MELDGTNSYTNGTYFNSGTLVLGSPTAASTYVLNAQNTNASKIIFGSGSGARTLAFYYGNAPQSVIYGMRAGDRFDILNFLGLPATVSTDGSLNTHDSLVATGTGSFQVTIQLDQSITGTTTFSTSLDGNGGTCLTLGIPAPVVWTSTSATC